MVHKAVGIFKVYDQITVVTLVAKEKVKPNSNIDKKIVILLLSSDHCTSLNVNIVKMTKSV